jgi:hypothetical protein
LNPRGQIHSLPPKPLGHGHTWCQGHESNVLRSFITSSAFQTGALTTTASLANLVEEEGIEPSFAGCRPAVLPLNDSPKTWLRAGELNATRMAYGASMTPVHLPAEKLWSGKLGSNQRPLDYRSSAQTTLSFSRMEPRARFELAFPNYKSGAPPTMLTGLGNSGANGANRTLIGCLPCALPLSYIGWSQRGYSKPRPPRYECGALPLELLWRGASAENRTPLIGLAIRCPANGPHPQKVWSGRR